MALIIVVLLGLCAGSFVNALVWRLKNKKDWVRERSICPDCKHTLSGKDLVPVLSWLELRGRCRYCNKKIHWQYPLVEVICAALFATSYLFWPLALSGIGWPVFAVWLLIVTVGLALSVYDFKWMILPDGLVLTLSILSVIFALLRSWQLQSPNNLVFSVVAAAFLFGLFWLIFQISDGKWIGGGDVKMMPALGLLSGGITAAVLVIFGSSLAGVVIAIPLIISGKGGRQTKLPYGPLLLIATFVVVLFGQSAIEWYKSLVGL